MLLVGSQALNYWLGKPFDKKRDTDIIASEKELNSIGLSFGGGDQIRIRGFNGDYEYISSSLLNNEEFTSTDFCVASPETLFIMKRSHLFRPIKFSRHIGEFQRIKTICSGLDQKGKELLKKRIKLTKEKFGDKVPRLNMSNEEFFDDDVTKYYVHDHLHEVVSYYERPIYEKLKRDNSLAKCEKDLWLDLSYEDKLRCVREECYVIGLERKIIPKIVAGDKYMPGKFAFDAALEKVCTTLTSGYFRNFAIDNWAEIRSDIVDFVSLFLDKKDELERI